MTIGSEGMVFNPATSNNPISANPLPPLMGRQGEYVVSGLRGKYGTMAMNKSLFNFNVTAVTVPAVAITMISVFSLWNPPSSGVLAEMVDTEVGQVLATTVADTVAWCFSSGSAALAGTFTTRGVANTNYFSARAGDFPNGQAIPYSAYTHSGTPVIVDMVGSFGGITDPGLALPTKVYDGRFWVPPGTVISACMSTAAGTGSGLDLSCRWVEWPFI